MFSGLEAFIRDYSADAIFLLLAGESLGLPLPGETVLISAAVLSGRGNISFNTLLFAASAGAVSGNAIGYLLGRTLGRSLLLRYGRKIGVTAERLNKVEAVFARYGGATVMFGRFFVVLRQLTGIIAGMLEMNWRWFLVFNVFGSTLWVFAWVLFGFYIGLHSAEIDLGLHKLGLFNVIVATTAVVTIVVCVYKIRNRGSRTL